MAVHEYRFDAIGTKWYLAFELSQDAATACIEAIHARIALFDRHYSRFRADSLVAEMSRKAGKYRLPDDAEPMLRLYENLYKVTNGAFTPLIGSTLVEAGYDAAYTLTPGEVHAPRVMPEVLTYEPPFVTLCEPVLLDVGAAGKGYLVDLVAEILKSFNAPSYTIDAGGDIAVWSQEETSVKIGLEHPGDPTQVVGVATMSNKSICGSAGNRRTWGKYHHIIDPRTLESPAGILATWVVADSTMLADALATCIYLVPPEQLAGEYAFEYVVVYSDYSLACSKEFPGELFMQ